MKNKSLLIVAIGFMVGLVSCSQNDESDETNAEKQMVTFVGGDSDNNASAKIATRTSFDENYSGFLDSKGKVNTKNTTPIHFNWTSGDYIFVKWGTTDNDVTKMFATTDKGGTTKISGEQRQAYFRGYVGTTDILSNNNCEIYYPGCKSEIYNEVTIKAIQNQSALNNSTHIGEDGDCAVATPTSPTEDGTDYSFTLDHKSTCFVIFPHMHDNGESATITSLVVSSSNSNLAGTYTMSEDGSLTLKSNGSNTVTLNANTNNFVISSKTASQANALYIIVAPSTETSTLTFTLNFSYSSAGGTYSKTASIKNATWDAGYVYPITIEIPSAK